MAGCTTRKWLEFAWVHGQTGRSERQVLSAHRIENLLNMAGEDTARCKRVVAAAHGSTTREETKQPSDVISLQCAGRIDPG